MKIQSRSIIKKTNNFHVFRLILIFNVYFAWIPFNKRKKILIFLSSKKSIKISAYLPSYNPENINFRSSPPCCGTNHNPRLMARVFNHFRLTARRRRFNLIIIDHHPSIPPIESVWSYLKKKDSGWLPLYKSPLSL